MVNIRGGPRRRSSLTFQDAIELGRALGHSVKRRRRACCCASGPAGALAGLSLALAGRKRRPGEGERCRPGWSELNPGLARAGLPRRCRRRLCKAASALLNSTWTLASKTPVNSPAGRKSLTVRSLWISWRHSGLGCGPMLFRSAPTATKLRLNRRSVHQFSLASRSSRNSFARHQPSRLAHRLAAPTDTLAGPAGCVTLEPCGGRLERRQCHWLR